MKTVFGFLALASVMTVSISANAMLKPSPSAPSSLRTDSNFSTVRANLANELVLSAASHPRYLLGTNQRDSLLGSTNFRTTAFQQDQRITLIASLRQNDAKKQIPSGVSSNPKDFHLDVASTTGAAPITRANVVRLDFRGSHTTPINVGTRTLIYDKEINGGNLPGRLVAVVNQTADPQNNVWKTNGTYLYFQSK